MTIIKYDIPVLTDGGVPNTNNLSDEMNTINTLSTKLTRSNSGQMLYTSLSSGISYNTADYSTDSSIYNKGETGLYNLLIKELDRYILQAKDLNTYGTGTIPNTGWNLTGGQYKYSLYVAISGVTENQIVNITIDKDDISASNIAGLSPTNESYNGGIIVYANNIPTKDIRFTYTVFK